MMRQIVGGLEAGQCQVQSCREFNLTPSVVCNSWKQFQGTVSIERRPAKGRTRTATARDHHLSIIERPNTDATAS
ncbi:HTH_Tnp_Tc3_2 domain-containing protein [Trichonephila clavipes]|nr:HTH_Tnp_Tc3_2 domain-containing protein [Trichonephila clavipes]